MPSEAPLPVLPKYESPKPRPTATLPENFELKAGPLNKLITRMLPKNLKSGKNKGQSLKLSSKMPNYKPGKKHKVHFK